MRRENRTNDDSYFTNSVEFVPNLPHVFSRQRIQHVKSDGDTYVGGTLAETPREIVNTIKKINGNPFLKNSIPLTHHKLNSQGTFCETQSFYYEGNSPKVAKRIADLLN